MDLFLVRHAIAEDRDEFSQRNSNDSLRPLTRRGRHRMALIAKKFCQWNAQLDIIATSPYLRARETAEIIQSCSTVSDIVEIEELVPSAPVENFAQWLKHNHASRVVAVGHEPHLSELASFLLTGEITQLNCKFKKGGIMHLRFSSDDYASRAALVGFYSPKVLI